MMNSIAKSVFYLGLALTPARAQQIASVDLTRRIEQEQVPGIKGKTILPQGCEKLLPGVTGDGDVLPTNNESHEISVQMVNVDSEDLAIGGEVEGEVQLRNIGNFPVSIPWSPNPEIAVDGQNSDHLQWEEGGFTGLLMGSGRLVSLVEPLFGSNTSAGSLLTIHPGEWVTARVKFKLELQYPIPGRFIRKGKGELRVEWEQTARTSNVKNCAVSTGWFRYRNYYKQSNPTTTITVK